MIKRNALIGLLGLALLFILPVGVSAQSLFEHQHTTVPVGETVGDVYAIGGDVDILGHTTGAVVVINGNLHLASSARVDGAVVVIGGRVDQDAGSALSNGIYNITLDTATQNSLLMGGGLVAGVWALQLAGSLLLVLIPVSVRLIGGRRAAEFIKRQAASSWRKRLYVGALSGAIIAAFSLLCLVSVIGIPLLLMAMLVLLVAFVFGVASVSYQIGGLLRENLITTEWIRLIMGASLIAAFANIPVVGSLVLLLIALLSLGNFTQWLFALRKRRSEN